MRQVRTIRYRDIAEDLAHRISSGEFTSGRLLPSESELSGHYSASRVTVRRALEQLRSDGLAGSRQGFGWFVATEPVRQPLARLDTIESQLVAEGRRSERRIIEFAFVEPPAEVAAVLQIGRPAEEAGGARSVPDTAARVLKVRRVNLADGEPFALVTVWCPEGLGSHVTRAQVAEHSFYDLLPVELGGATQTIGADAAGQAEATHLHVPVGSPVLRCRRTTTDSAGRAVLVGDYVFPGHRTEFIVDLPQVEPSIAPSGLRLLE